MNKIISFFILFILSMGFLSAQSRKVETLLGVPITYKKHEAYVKMVSIFGKADLVNDTIGVENTRFSVHNKADIKLIFRNSSIDSASVVFERKEKDAKILFERIFSEIKEKYGLPKIRDRESFVFGWDLDNSKINHRLLKEGNGNFKVLTTYSLFEDRTFEEDINLPINELGDIEYVEVVENNKSIQETYTLIKRWLYNNYDGNYEIMVDDPKNGEIEFKIVSKDIIHTPIYTKILGGKSFTGEFNASINIIIDIKEGKYRSILSLGSIESKHYIFTNYNNGGSEIKQQSGRNFTNLYMLYKSRDMKENFTKSNSLDERIKLVIADLNAYLSSTSRNKDF